MKGGGGVGVGWLNFERQASFFLSSPQGVGGFSARVCKKCVNTSRAVSFVSIYLLHII